MLLEENRTDVAEDEAALRDAYSWYGDLLRRPRRCYSCGAAFTEADNVGLRLCRVHTGQHLSEWSCCGKTLRDAPGCLKQDHFSGTMSVVALVPHFALAWLPNWQRRSVCAVQTGATFACIANPGEHELTESELALWRATAVCFARQ